MGGAGGQRAIGYLGPDISGVRCPFRLLGPAEKPPLVTICSEVPPKKKRGKYTSLELSYPKATGPTCRRHRSGTPPPVRTPQAPKSQLTALRACVLVQKWGSSTLPATRDPDATAAFNQKSRLIHWESANQTQRASSLAFSSPFKTLTDNRADRGGFKDGGALVKGDMRFLVKIQPSRGRKL